jgi:hypothetical protein
LTQSAAPVAVTKGGSIVDYCARFSTLNARYEEFLFAQVCEEANGMRLSVLSALARMNVDPWEEATRLAAMPRAIAEKTLLSILDAVSGRSWKSPEAAAIAARLVRLLPQPGEAATVAATTTAQGSAQFFAQSSPQGSAQRKSYWWVWLGFALVMSFMTPHHRPAPANAVAVTTQSGVTTPLNSGVMAPNPIGQSR